MRHLNGAKFGSAPDQFRAKTAMVGVCKRSWKTALKTKTLQKALVFGSLFGRIGV